MPGVRLWFSSHALELGLSAGLLLCAWYVSSALASRWRMSTNVVRLVLSGFAVLLPFAIGPGPLDTFWRKITDRPAIAIAVVAALLGTGIIAIFQRTEMGRLRLASLLAVLIILAVTASPEGAFGWNLPDGLSSCLSIETTPGANWLYDALPNFALYFPAGLFVASLSGSARRTVVALVCLSLGIELYQAAFTERVCQATDFAANSVGAGLGAGLAATLRRFGTAGSARTAEPRS